MSEPAGTADDSAIVQVVRLTAKPGASGEPAIACTLPAGSMMGRVDQWPSLLSHVVGREPVDGGVRCTFDASVPNVDLIELVTAEQDCCQFFSFVITVDGRGVALEVRAPDDAREIVESLFGVEA